jgi:hypothetical protein
MEDSKYQCEECNYESLYKFNVDRHKAAKHKQSQHVQTKNIDYKNLKKQNRDALVDHDLVTFKSKGLNTNAYQFKPNQVETS